MQGPGMVCAECSAKERPHKTAQPSQEISGTLEILVIFSLFVHRIFGIYHTNDSAESIYAKHR